MRTLRLALFVSFAIAFVAFTLTDRAYAATRVLAHKEISVEEAGSIEKAFERAKKEAYDSAGESMYAIFFRESKLKDGHEPSVKPKEQRMLSEDGKRVIFELSIEF